MVKILLILPCTERLIHPRETDGGEEVSYLVSDRVLLVQKKTGNLRNTLFCSISFYRTKSSSRDLLQLSLIL